jgi:ribosomal protein L40E
MSIGDQLTPRERQIRETLAGIRPGLDPAHDFPLEGDVESLGPLPASVPPPGVRRAQVAQNETAFWICRACRARVPGVGGECPECGFDTADLDRLGQMRR